MAMAMTMNIESEKVNRDGKQISTGFGIAKANEKQRNESLWIYKVEECSLSHSTREKKRWTKREKEKERDLPQYAFI